jgi:hypothetical protein
VFYLGGIMLNPRFGTGLLALAVPVAFAFGFYVGHVDGHRAGLIEQGEQQRLTRETLERFLGPTTSPLAERASK